MDPAVAEVLKEYHVRYEHEFGSVLPQLGRAEVVDVRDQLLMSIGPEAGTFINAVARSARSKTILELGTSYGHSTIYLAEAAKANGGAVISCDLNGDKQKFALAMLQRANLDAFVTFRLGDAAQVTASLEVNVDFCLIDLWNDAYIPAFDALYPKLNPLAYVVADNMIAPDQVAGERYREHIRRAPGLDSVLLPIGWGLEVSQRRTSNGR